MGLSRISPSCPPAMQASHSYNKINLCQRVIKGFQAIAFMALGHCTLGKKMWRRAIRTRKLKDNPLQLPSTTPTNTTKNNLVHKVSPEVDKKHKVKGNTQQSLSTSNQAQQYNKNDFSSFVRKDNPANVDDFCKDIMHWDSKDVAQAKKIVCALLEMLEHVKDSKKSGENQYFSVRRKKYYELYFKVINHQDDSSFTLFEDGSESLISKDLFLSIIRGYILKGGEWGLFQHPNRTTDDTIYLTK